MEKFITIDQLSELIQMSKSTIYHWTHIGFIPYYKFPKGIRFRLSEVENWIKKRRRKGREIYAGPVNWPR